MSALLKTSVMATGLVAMLIADAPLLPLQLVPDAQAILGVRRRTAVVVGTEVHAADEAKMAQSQQQTAAAQQQAAAAAPAPPPAAAGKQLPVGTVVPALPKGCTSTPVGGVEYYYCGGNFYRAVFQGNALVYVTAQPK
jgi:Family of unknown function (DUF6515)